MTDNSVRVQTDIDAANKGTDWLHLRGSRNFFDISIADPMTGTVHLQRKRPGELASQARDIEAFAAPVEKIGEVQGHWDLRLFIKPGNFGAGSVIVELGT